MIMIMIMWCLVSLQCKWTLKNPKHIMPSSFISSFFFHGHGFLCFLPAFFKNQLIEEEHHHHLGFPLELQKSLLLLLGFFFHSQNGEELIIVRVFTFEQIQQNNSFIVRVFTFEQIQQNNSFSVRVFSFT